MRRRSSALVLLLPLLLAGCGGEGGDTCGAGTERNPNPEYSGQYNVEFTPSTSGNSAREFLLSVAADGTISGVGRQPVSGATFGGTVTGSVLDSDNSCGGARTYIEFSYTLEDGRTGQFSANRTIGETIVGTYPISGGVNGSLTVERAILTTN